MPPVPKRPVPPRRGPAVEPSDSWPPAPRARQESHDDPELARELSERDEREADLLAQLEEIRRSPPDPSFPPPTVEDRRRSKTTSSAPPSEKAIRSPWERLGYKVATAVVAGLVLVIGAGALWAYTAISAKTEAIKAAQKAKEEVESREAKIKQWAAVLTWILDCRNDQQLEVNQQLLPAPDKMGSAGKPKSWSVGCPTKLPPMP